MSNLFGINFPEHAIWNLVDLPQVSESSIVDKDVVPSLESSPWHDA